MKKTTFVVVGLGNRGAVYASHQLKFPEHMEVTAIADTRQECLDTANAYLHLPEDRLFHSAEALLEQPKMADVMVIATQDAQHRDHAIRAMEQGYDLLLEKPIANRMEDIQKIVEAAHCHQRRVVICHVLRYTPFYRKVKDLLDAGVVGRILNIEAAEHVSCYHMAHAYVRGKWRRKEDSSPIILAKCSHDMDIILWLAGKKCLKVTSFGGLDHFTGKNRPEGAPMRCEDGCPKEDCPYHAIRFYLPRVPGWPTKNMHPAPTEENILEMLRTTTYGECVYRQDNDVVDHQCVNMLLEDGITVTFNLNGFHTRGTRTIRIGGSEGELWGDLSAGKISWQKHGGEKQVFDLSNNPQATGSGHNGGDTGLVWDVLQFFGEENFNTDSITTLDRSAESHYVAFAAEASRESGGMLICMEDFA